MAKTNIYFNGKDYSIDDAALASAKDSLKNHFSTAMAGSGGNTITWDGNEEGRVHVKYGDGVLIFVKITDEVFYADELLGATITLSDGTSGQLEQEAITVGDNYVSISGYFMSMSEANINLDGLIFPEAGTYFANYPSIGLYFESITFPSSSSGTPITFDGTTYQVDPTKLATITDDFVAHLETLKGGGLEPITWDGVVGDRVTVDLGIGASITKVSDKILSANDLIDSAALMSNGFTHHNTNQMVHSLDGGIVCSEFVIVSISDPDAFSGTASNLLGQTVSFTETGTYFMHNSTIYTTSLTFPNTSSDGGTTKLTINGTEYLVDSSKLSNTITELQNHLEALSNL